MRLKVDVGLKLAAYVVSEWCDKRGALPSVAEVLQHADYEAGVMEAS